MNTEGSFHPSSVSRQEDFLKRFIPFRVISRLCDPQLSQLGGGEPDSLVQEDLP